MMRKMMRPQISKLKYMMPAPCVFERHSSSVRYLSTTPHTSNLSQTLLSAEGTSPKIASTPDPAITSLDPLTKTFNKNAHPPNLDSNTSPINEQDSFSTSATAPNISRTNSSPLPLDTPTITYAKLIQLVTPEYKFIFGAGITLFGLLGAFVSVTSTLLYVLYVEYSDENSLKYKINNAIQTDVDFKDYIHRLEVEKALNAMIKSNDRVESFFVLVGENGCGKTTLVQLVCKEVGQGVVFLDVPENINRFGAEFAKATGYIHRHHGGLAKWIHSKVYGISDKQDILTWEGVFEQFKSTAADYKKEHGKCAVLVIDNINRLAKKSPEILEILQEAARDAVSANTFIVVFVTSDGLAPTQISSRNSKGRGKVFRIGDMNKIEVMQYLTSKNIEEKEKVFELLGGRLIDLNNFTNELNKGVSFADAKKMKMDEIKVNYESVKGEIEDVAVGEKMNQILKLSLIKSFTLDDLEMTAGKERLEYKKIVTKLVNANILCRVDYSYRLHSTSVESYLNETL